MPAPDVHKILKDLEAKVVGIDPKTNHMQDGYFVAFRDVGLPIHQPDFDNPWSPLGANLEADVPQAPPADPANAPKTASSQLTQDRIFSANIGDSMQSYLNTFLLTDDKLRMNNSYSVMPGSSKVSDSWYAIITGANGIAKKIELSDELKAGYAAATAALMDDKGNTTPHYQAYLQYEEKYKDKVNLWHRAYSNAMTDPMKFQNWPIQGVAYEDDANEAMDQWVSFGFKSEIENALNTLAAQGTDPAMALISRAKKRFKNSLNEFQGVGEIPYTLMLPSSWYDADNDDGWFTYTSSDYHSESHYSTSSTSYGGGGGFDIGLWSASGGFDHSENRSSLQLATDDLEVSLSYCAVDIKRPWLDTTLLNLKNWFLMGDYPQNCISDGTMGQELPQGGFEPGFFPSLVTSLILVKDVTLRGENFMSDWRSHDELTTGGGSVGWGPFCINGHYSTGNAQQDYTVDDSSQQLQSHGVQLLGYVSAINPASPAVNSKDYLKG
jgi:hypothetical protein